jgi:hypothetical protein
MFWVFHCLRPVGLINYYILEGKGLKRERGKEKVNKTSYDYYYHGQPPLPLYSYLLGLSRPALRLYP